MRERLHPNSTVTKIISTMVLGIVLVTIAVITFVINVSKNIFIDTYGKSQERVFQQVEKELNDAHKTMMKVASAIDSSWAFRLYFDTDDKELDTAMEFKNVYQMQEDLNKAVGAEASKISVMVIGLNQKSYINRAEKISTPVAEILSNEFSERVMENLDMIHYQFFEQGFTATSQGGSVLIGAKALTYLSSRKPYGIVYFTMRESDVIDYYDYFTGDTTSFFMLDQNNNVVSSDQGQTIGTQLDKGWVYADHEELRTAYQENNTVYSILHTNLPYYGYEIYGVIDNGKALDNQYNIGGMVLICLIIALLVLTVVFFFTRQITRPLSVMAGKMSQIRGGELGQYMEVTGTEEIRELASTYNYMLDDLQRYIEELMRAQEEKRRSEIKALQMQINPHYIYNTLASIKWLIWQGDAQKSTQTIDAFIKLLRNTINNTNEFITVEQEIENMENYVLINQTRYGEQVTVGFDVELGCEEALIPKLILQPFIENAFFHAFPSGKKGHIRVSVRETEQKLHIEISDNGIGMDQSSLQSLNGKTEHFSGIGINNVDDRLVLLYGAGYGVNILSEKDQGTTVIIELPHKEEKGGRDEDRKESRIGE